VFLVDLSGCGLERRHNLPLTAPLCKGIASGAGKTAQTRGFLTGLG
jgi:hypothetical protein